MKGKKSRQEDRTATNPHNCISLPFYLKYPTISSLVGISPIHSNTFHIFCKKCSCVPKNQTKIVGLHVHISNKKRVKMLDSCDFTHHIEFHITYF